MHECEHGGLSIRASQDWLSIHPMEFPKPSARGINQSINPLCPSLEETGSCSVKMRWGLGSFGVAPLFGLNFGGKIYDSAYIDPDGLVF